MSNLILDEWQKEVLETEGNICLCSGRQVGKSQTIAIKAAEYAVNNKSKSVLIISATERQAEEMFNKTLYYLDDNYKRMIKRGRQRPTKSKMYLHNGSIIRCLPTGLAGTGIRGFTIDMLIADEAAFIPDEVWSAVTPMLLTTGGDIILVSTPFGRQGYFYECYHSEDFKTFHVNSEQVIRERPISKTWSELQRRKALEHLEREKNKMTELQYAQEYLGQFVDELRQLFSDELIKKVCVLRRQDGASRGSFYLGVDIARLGDDETTFEIVDLRRNGDIYHVESVVKTKQLTTQTFDNILNLEKQYNFKKIGIDAGSGSLGVGILDFLLREDSTRRKVVDLDNRKRLRDFKGEKKSSLMKEDMYMNLLSLMEKGRIKLLDDDKVIQSLRSVQYEHIITANKKSQTRIFGKDTHVSEGLTRAVWLAAEEKQLNIRIRSFPV